MCTGVMGRTEDGTLGLALRQFSVDRKLKSEVVSDEFWSPCHTMVSLGLDTRGRSVLFLRELGWFELGAVSEQGLPCVVA